MPNPKPKTRRNVIAQEEVVSALWHFAANLQFRPNEGQIATNASEPDKGTKCSLKHVRTALDKIMEAFGYEVTEIY